MSTRHLPLFLAALCLFVLLAGSPAGAASPSALWNIVHGECVPGQQLHDNPAPCALVDLSGGVARGYVVLKDLVGATQFLVLPTARIAGIESPAVLAPDTPDYFADAWAARSFVRARAPAPLPREDLSLAVNSIDGRTQNQLHIHVDCIRADVRNTLIAHLSAIGDTWKQFPLPLAGHDYMARRLRSADIIGTNPFLLLAQSSAKARADMGLYTLVLAGAFFEHTPGFILLADRADPARGDFGSGESLQDHACALAHRSR